MSFLLLNKEGPQVYCIDTVNGELIDVVIRWVYSYWLLNQRTGPRSSNVLIQTKCSNSVNIDNIVFCVTVNILGNEFKL